MKIKTKLQIITLLTIIIIFIIGTILFSASEQLIESHDNAHLAEQVHNGIFELNLISYDYITYHEERARVQWYLKYNSISNLLTEEELEGDEKQIILNNMRQNHENIKSIFSQMVELQEGVGFSNQDIVEPEELERRLTSQLFVISQDMVSDASKLVDINNSQAFNAIERIYWLVISLILVMSTVIAGNLFIFNKYVVAPVVKLKQGTEIIGKGNLDYRLNDDSNDEIGHISRAFDGMLDKLKIMTASRDELNREIEARKKSEEEIRLHSEIMKNMTEGVYIVGLEDVIIRYTNPKFEEMFGYNPGEMVGKHASIVNAPTDKDPEETTKEMMDIIYKTGKWHGEIENIKKDGTHFWCYASVSVIDTSKFGKILVAVHTDITERKQADENVRDSKKIFESLYSESPVGIELYDSDGCLVDVNATCLEIFGVDDVEDVKGFKLFEDPNLSEDIINNLKNGESVQFESEFDFDVVKEMSLYETSKSGKVYLDCHITVMDLKGISKMKYMVHVRDITELKKMEELEIKNQSLALADKTKSEFLSIMSHELRTPLNVSIGFSEILKMGKAGELNKKQEAFIDKIIISNKHLNKLIGEILDLSKIEAGKMELDIEKISLPHFIEEILSILNVMATEQNVVLKIDTAPEIDFIEGDRQRLRQIIINLVNNAIKFSNDNGGTVTISAKKEGDMVSISISDTGIGIKEDDIVKIFAPFKQLDMGYTRKHGGTGLGLAITKQLVELHGGEMWVESKYGEGTTFTFTLPIKAVKKKN